MKKTSSCQFQNNKWFCFSNKSLRPCNSAVLWRHIFDWHEIWARILYLLTLWVAISIPTKLILFPAVSQLSENVSGVCNEPSVDVIHLPLLISLRDPPGVNLNWRACGMSTPGKYNVHWVLRITLELLGRFFGSPVISPCTHMPLARWRMTPSGRSRKKVASFEQPLFRTRAVFGSGWILLPREWTHGE